MKKLKISSAKILNHGYKFYLKWNDFVKNNKDPIDNYVNKEIKEPLKNIKDNKQRDKIFKREMQDYTTDLTHTWNEMKKLSMVKCGNVADEYGVSGELDRPGELTHQEVSKFYDIINDIVLNYYEEGRENNSKVIEKITGNPIRVIIKLWKAIDKKWGRYHYTIRLGKFVAALREMGVILDKKYGDLIDEVFYR